jgi:hypothetical protein
VTVENERRIQGLRSSTLALDPPADLDYTTATNMLIELGFLVLEEIGHAKPPLAESTIPVSKPTRVLVNYLAEAVIRGSETEEIREYWTERFSAEGLLKVLAGLSMFQPREIGDKKEEVPARS